MPFVSKVLLYRNPSLQCWLRGRHTVANDQFCEQATVGSNTVDKQATVGSNTVDNQATVGSNTVDNHGHYQINFVNKLL